MTFVLAEDQQPLHRKERMIVAIFLIVVALLTILDIIEDTVDGAPLSHTITEGVIVVGAISGATYIWRRAIRGLAGHNALLSSELSRTREDLEHWRMISGRYMKGFTEAVGEQLKRWGLTEAEQDVAFLLLKGLSLKEIADCRSTSERTVRHQATTIYKKSGLESRSQLAAFFLEDAFER